MRIAISRFAVMAALAALVVVAAGTAAGAVCPASPNYTLDFTNDQTCLTPNVNATILVPNSAAITGWAGDGTTVTFTASNSFTAGELIKLSGFSTSTFFNNLTVPVLNPTGTTFQITSAFTGTSEAGVATPIPATPALQLTSSTGNQVGSAWFNTAQSVQNGFSTSFQFQFTNPSNPPADGIAFVIQNAGTGVHAIGFTGGNGGALGYGDNDNDGNPVSSTGEGIPNSVAIEFDSYLNGGWDSDANHVAVQSCGTGSNTSHHHFACNGGSPLDSTLGLKPVASPTFADGHVHKVTITYTPPTLSGCGDSHTLPCSGSLHVILDNADLFPSGVTVDLGSLLTLGTGGTAYVGFTGATGGSNENQYILNWTFAPQAQSAPITTNTAAILNFNGGTNNNAYDYNAILTAGGVTSVTGTIKPILIGEEACEKLVNANRKFGKAQCFVYQNAGKDSNNNSVDSAVLFELTCPDQTGGTCGDIGPANFFADLGSNFTFTKAENPGFQLLNSTIGPYAGWLKGSGLDLLHPCTPNPNGTTPLFASNQISAFSVVGDPTGKTVGKSGGGGSCWVATYFTAGELPPGISITKPAPFATYNKGTTQFASYTCSTPSTSKDPSILANTTGPYLTVASCSQSQAPNNNTTASCTSPTFAGGISCTNGVIDTSAKGPHVFLVTTKDTGGNVNAKAVVYNVK